jgi:voltage-gated potassium channel
MSSLHPMSVDRQFVMATTVRVVVATVVLLVFYALVPIHSETDAGVYARLAGAVVILAALVYAESRAIVRSPYPRFRAIEAVVLAVPVFIVLFSLLYLGLAHTSGSNFTEPLDRMGAVYFTMTVLATVGFGDITARTDLARGVVTAQMILDFVLIGAVVRVFFTAAKAGVTRRDARPHAD